MLAALALDLGVAAATCAGLLFLAAAAGKLRHAALLPAVIANYRLLPGAAVKPLAAGLPWAEAGIGLLLLIGGRLAPPAAGAAAALLLVFAAAMGINLRRGRRHIDCGCGLSGLRQPLRGALVARNLLLAAALLPRLLLPGMPPLAEQAVAIAAGLGAFLLLLLHAALLALPDARPYAA